MFRRILRHEWRLLSADATVGMIFVVLAAAIVYGTLNGSRWVGFQTQAIEDALSEERERLARHEDAIASANAGAITLSPFQDPRNPQNAAARMAPRYAVLPPAPLAALSVGQSDLLPYYFKVTSDAKETVTAGAELENPHRLLTGRFDLAFVIIYLYPLLILAISYNLLSAEKEQGTLALLLSQPVSLRTLVLAKVMVRVAVFLALIVALVGVSLAFAAVDLGAPGAISGLLLWLLAVTAYGLVWFLLAVAVAALGRSSSTTATVLAAVWLLAVVLVPALLNVIATTVYPVPSRVEMVQAMRTASDEANAAGATLLAKYYGDHPELASGDAAQAMNDFAMIRVAVAADVEKRVRPVLDRYEQQLAAQQRTVAALRYLSPAILIQDALNDISGTGLPRHRHFMAQVTQYHDTWREYFVPLIFKKARLASLSDLPAFAYAEEPPAAIGRRVAVTVTGLLVLAAGLLALAWGLLVRYPIVA